MKKAIWELEKPEKPELEFDTGETEPREVCERILEQLLDA